MLNVLIWIVLFIIIAFIISVIVVLIGVRDIEVDNNEQEENNIFNNDKIPFV